MEFAIGKPVKAQKNPTNVYKVVVTWLSAEDNYMLIEDPLELRDFILIVDAYKAHLAKDWNDWCNVEREHIEQIVNDLGLDVEMEFFFEIYEWRDHPDYDFLDMPESYKVTYYNDHGIEYSVSIKK